jgi:hypothetical protein
MFSTSETFFLIFFHLRLVKSTDMEPTDVGGYVLKVMLQGILSC